MVVALTREGVEASGVENVDYLAGDARARPLPDDSFDVVHAHQVLWCDLPDPVQAPREMVRVCRPGGVVAVRDADYSGSSTWRLPEPSLRPPARPVPAVGQGKRRRAGRGSPAARLGA
ncbi:MAG: class I SAM-dependent methyltransferase [Micropruina glycogenica]